MTAPVATGTRRRTELGLILLAMLIIGGAYTLASLARAVKIPANIGPFLGVVFLLFVIAHVANRRLAPRADSMLLPIAALLNGLGYVVIARLNEKLAAQQAAWTAVGVRGYVVTLALFRRVRSLERLRYTIGLVGVVLLMLPLLPVVGVSLLSALGGWLSAKQGGGRNRVFRYLGFALVLASQLPQPAAIEIII